MRPAVLAAIAGLALAQPVAVYAQGQPEAAPTTELRLRLAREIVDAGFPPDQRMDVLGGVMQQIVSQINVAQPELQSDPEVYALVQRYQQRALAEGMEVLRAHLDPMMEGLAVGYADVFTLDELQALHAYVTSPQGYGFLAKTTAVNAHPAYVAASQEYLNAYLQRVPQLQAELREELMQMLSSREDGEEQS